MTSSHKCGWCVVHMHQPSSVFFMIKRIMVGSNILCKLDHSPGKVRANVNNVLLRLLQVGAAMIAHDQPRPTNPIET